MCPKIWKFLLFQIGNELWLILGQNLLFATVFSKLLFWTPWRPGGWGRTTNGCCLAHLPQKQQRLFSGSKMGSQILKPSWDWFKKSGFQDIGGEITVNEIHLREMTFCSSYGEVWEIEGLINLDSTLHTTKIYTLNYLQGMLQSVLRIPLDQVSRVESATYDERDNKSKNIYVAWLNSSYDILWDDWFGGNLN